MRYINIIDGTKLIHETRISNEVDLHFVVKYFNEIEEFKNKYFTIFDVIDGKRKLILDKGLGHANLILELSESHSVYWMNSGYEVKDGLITFTHNNDSIGLTQKDGTLNGNPFDFYVIYKGL